jgi:hypothetical protein
MADFDEELELKPAQGDFGTPRFTMPPGEATKPRRGRPPGSKNKPRLHIPSATDVIDKDKLIAERAERLSAKMQLAGIQVTNIFSVLDEPWTFLPMTPKEAKNIADPLASYLYRNGELGEQAAALFERWDLIALSLALLAYSVRVFKDYREWRKENPNESAEPPEIKRPNFGAGGNRPSQTGGNQQQQETPNEGQDEVSSVVRIPNLVGDLPPLTTPPVPPG